MKARSCTSATTSSAAWRCLIDTRTIGALRRSSLEALSRHQSCGAAVEGVALGGVDMWAEGGGLGGKSSFRYSMYL